MPIQESIGSQPPYTILSVLMDSTIPPIEESQRPADERPVVIPGSNPNDMHLLLPYLVEGTLRRGVRRWGVWRITERSAVRAVSTGLLGGERNTLGVDQPSSVIVVDNANLNTLLQHPIAILSFGALAHHLPLNLNDRYRLIVTLSAENAVLSAAGMDGAGLVSFLDVVSIDTTKLPRDTIIQPPAPFRRHTWTQLVVDFPYTGPDNSLNLTVRPGNTLYLGCAKLSRLSDGDAAPSRNT